MNLPQSSAYLKALRAGKSRSRGYSIDGYRQMVNKEKAMNQVQQEYQSAYDVAKQENEKRYDQGLDIHNKTISMYSPDGSYGAGAMASYNQGKDKARSRFMQGLVNAGMANLTRGGGYDKSYEKEVGNNFRLNLADRRTDALSGAYANKANWIFNREDQYPDTSMYVQLMRQLGES